MTINQIRKILKDAGLNQIERQSSQSRHGFAFGDYSVRNQTVTTYSRISPKHKIHRTSFATGKIEIEVSHFCQPNTQNIIRDLLIQNNLDFYQTYNGFLLN